MASSISSQSRDVVIQTPEENSALLGGDVVVQTPKESAALLSGDVVLQVTEESGLSFMTEQARIADLVTKKAFLILYPDPALLVLAGVHLGIGVTAFAMLSVGCVRDWPLLNLVAAASIVLVGWGTAAYSMKKASKGEVIFSKLDDHSWTKLN